MKIPVIISLAIVLVSYHLLPAQHKVKGIYDPETQTFRTKDRTYWISKFENGIAKISHSGYFGLMDSTGTVLCLPRYDEIFDFEGNVAIITFNGRYGIINTKGKELIAPYLAFIDDFHDEMAWYREIANGRWGLLNSEGTIIFEPQYQQVYTFREGMAYAIPFSNKYHQVINKNGEVVYKKEKAFFNEFGKYEEIFNPENSWVQVKKTEQERLDKNRKTPPVKVTFERTPFRFSDSLAIVAEGMFYELRFGFIDKKGNPVIDTKYEDACNFVNGIAPVKSNGKWGIIDKTGKVVIDFNYESIHVTESDFIIIQENGLLGIINQKGKTVVPAKYAQIRHLFGDLFALYKGYEYKKGGIPLNDYADNWGVMNVRDNKVILPFEYNEIRPVNNQFGIGIKYKEQSVTENTPNFHSYPHNYYTELGYQVQLRNKLSFHELTGATGLICIRSFYSSHIGGLLIIEQTDNTDSTATDTQHQSLLNIKSEIEMEYGWTMSRLPLRAFIIEASGQLFNKAGIIEDGKFQAIAHSTIGTRINEYMLKSFPFCYQLDEHYIIPQTNNPILLDKEGYIVSGVERQRFLEKDIYPLGLIEKTDSVSGLKGVVDQHGNIVVPFRYIDVYIYDRGILAKKIGGKDYFDLTGKRIVRFTDLWY